MNVFSETEGKWVPASDEIELVNGGAIAARTQAKVIFLPNLNDRQPPIDLYLPDGRPLRSKIVGLAYTERDRSEEHTSELQSHSDLVCRLLLEKKNTYSTVTL